MCTHSSLLFDLNRLALVATQSPQAQKAATLRTSQPPPFSPHKTNPASASRGHVHTGRRVLFVFMSEPTNMNCDEHGLPDGALKRKIALLAERCDSL